MIRLLYISIFWVAFSFITMAQDYHAPQRTATDIARKQTEMMVRELGIHDSIMQHTLFQLHLRYAKMRDISNTRAEAMQRIQTMREELKAILGPELFAAFMNRQIENVSRSPKHPFNWIVTSSNKADTLPSTTATEQTPEAPSEPQP